MKRSPLRIASLASTGALAVLAGLATFAACSIYDTSLLLPAESPDAAPDVAPPAVDSAQPDTSGTDGAAMCAHAEPPVRPPAADSTPSDSITETFALATIDFAAVPDGGTTPVGYDLDDTCTCPGPDSCVNSLSTKTHCDEVGGRDNSAGVLLQAFASIDPLRTASVDASLAAGSYGLLVQVSQWNGQPNDSQVSVAVYVSNGLTREEDGASGGPVKGDGTDRWTVDPGSVLGGSALDGIDCSSPSAPCTPTFSNPDSYVADGVLVANLDYQLALGGSNGDLVLSLTGSVLTATLAPTSGGPSTTSGVLAGRWATSALLTNLAAISDPADSTQHLCGSDSTYQFLKTQICGAADITSIPGDDNTGAPCDSLSVAFGFTARPAQLAEVIEKNAAAGGCASDSGTPFHDSCGQ